jgi:hypothetical protein
MVMDCVQEANHYTLEGQNHKCNPAKLNPCPEAEAEEEDDGRQNGNPSLTNNESFRIKPSTAMKDENCV